MELNQGQSPLHQGRKEIELRQEFPGPACTEAETVAGTRTPSIKLTRSGCVVKPVIKLTF